MNKELTPLQAFRQIWELFELKGADIDEIKKKDLIETALKEKEKTDDILAYGGGVYATGGIIDKQLKALEIIKEKHLYWDISYQPYEEDNDYRAWDNELYQGIKITKEEYELLKEVLK